MQGAVAEIDTGQNRARQIDFRQLQTRQVSEPQFGPFPTDFAARKPLVRKHRVREFLWRHGVSPWED